MGRKFTKNTSVEKYKNHCQGFMENMLPNPKANIEISCFFQNSTIDSKAGIFPY